MFTSKDKAILRELAQKQLEAAHSEKNQERIAKWKLHNTFRGKRPMVHIEVDTFEQEVITPLLRCEDPLARRLEHDLYHNFINLTEFDDDKVVPDYFPVEWQTYFHPFGFEISETHATDSQGNSVGFQYNHVIEDLGDAYPTLKPSKFGVLREESLAYRQAAEEAFGDILPVQMAMKCLVAVPTQQVVHMMGMENMFYAMYDYPDEFKGMMNRLADDYLAFFHMLETEGYLLPTTSFQTLCQGSLCFTDELPDKTPLTTHDVWGFMDSQESVGLSPEMYHEFVFPCYRRIAEAYGLLSYGCCEPVHPIWDDVKTLHNLRKVSISPWCNEEIMGERLRGQRVIYQRKPSPNFLGVGKTLDEEAVREHITTTLKAAQGCKLEITQRDVYTIANDVDKVRRYVAIIRDLIDKLWQG